MKKESVSETETTRHDEDILEALDKLQTTLCSELVSDIKLRDEAHRRLIVYERLLEVIERSLSRNVDSTTVKTST